MGNANQRQLGSQLPSDPRMYIPYDLPKFQLQNRLGNGKFMKSYHMVVDGVPLVVKVYVRPFEEDLQAAASRLSNIWRTLSPMRHPFLLPYQMWIKSNTRLPRVNAAPVYLIRQYFMANLYERLSTRPFLTEIEKLWMVYQLLRCVEVVHSYQIVHGDIKLENLMVTSWNWLLLADFASFKPVALPDDDTTDFHYFFDTMNRQRCSIAPERFYRRRTAQSVYPSATSPVTGAGTTGPVDTAMAVVKDLQQDVLDSTTTAPESMVAATSMDVFSCGCAIAEVSYIVHPKIVA